MALLTRPASIKMNFPGLGARPFENPVGQMVLN